MGCETSNFADQNVQRRNYTGVPQNNFNPQLNNQQQNSFHYASQYQPVPNYQYGMQQSSQNQGFTYPSNQPAPTNQQYIPQSSQNQMASPVLSKLNQIANAVTNVQGKQMKLNSALNNKNNMKVAARRGIMPLYVNKKDDFLTHHLKTEMHLSKYARADLIKRRQVLQHNTYQAVLVRGYGKNFESITQISRKAYFQRIMLEIFENADKQFFHQGKNYDEVRQKVAERYLFQLYQHKEFMDAGLGKYASFVDKTQMSMSDTCLASDAALFPILGFLKQKYPQVADKNSVKFPEVKERKLDINLLDNFPSKSYSSPGLINVQTLFADLKFLIDRSLEEFADFQSDMKAMLGDQVLTDSKVKKITKNGVQEYTASPVRRVFIKWAETIIDRIPNIIVSNAFIDFIKSKSIIADNFYFQSTVQPTSHVKVIEFLCQLLEAAKYEISTLEIRKQFGFYIYDLLRCKTKRNTGEQVCEILKKMEETKITPSGKRFEVVRIKNRFKTANRDLMVNFRYGDVIVGEAQLCIDTSDVSEKTKKTNKFNHYIYQLERGLFGPTSQLIMQYEDFQRKDISANLQAEGKVKKRKTKKPNDCLKKTSRKCLNGHDMIELTGNFFIKNQEGVYEEATMICDYCPHVFKSNKPYYYCYFCTSTFCHNCDQQYKSESVKELQLRCNRQDLLPLLKTENELKKVFPQCPIVIFYLSNGASSVIYKDTIVLLKAIYKMQKKQLPPIYSFCCDGQDEAPVEKKYSIKEYPTTIVFNREGTAQTTLIGASWMLLEGLFQSQCKIIKNQPKALEVACWCQEPYQEFDNQEDKQIFCLNCGNANQSEGLIDNLLGQFNSKVFMCSRGHYRCLNCGFLADNEPSKYKDYRGKSYLFEKKQKPKLSKCQSGHQSIYVREINEIKELNCFKCRQDFVFNNVLGAGLCQHCNSYCCYSCIGIEEDNLKKVGGEIVNHTAQQTAEQGQKCLCNRLFKKVYNTRDYTNNVIQNKGQGEDVTQLLVKSVYEIKKRNWTCLICNREKNDGELHLACFKCPKLLEQTDTKINLEICIECAIGTDLLNRQLEEKITEIPTDYVCKSNHPVVKTKLAHNNEELTFDCVGCRDTFYIFTERYYCKSCRTNVCLSCAGKELTNKNPPKCLRKCNNNHNLKIKENPDTLRLCDGCKITIRKTHFACPDYCGFELCLNCAATPPGVDTTNNRMKHMNQDAVKKKMQEYERGWVDDFADALNEEGESNDGGLEEIGQQIQKGMQQLNQWWDS